MKLARFDPDAFLRDYWQQKPLLIRGAWDAWRNPLGPDELAGLACEEAVESRLVEQAGGQMDSDAARRLSAEQGPFPEQRFGKLGKAPWTLLVQAVDHHVPEVAALIEPFRFVPNWRIDDVMVSYASDGGGVGAHFDQYDVFLVQGLGRRRWRIGQRCDENTALLPHDELRLLAEFEPSDEWLLEPGDILYVPPRFAHDGVAVGDDCMTYSIGFRAPSSAELISGWSDHVASRLDDGDRYADPGLRAQVNPGEILPEALTALHALVSERLDDRAAFARWFGGYSTMRKYADVEWAPEEPVGAAQMRDYLARGLPLLRNPASRFSFIRGDAGSLVLCVDGETFDCAGDTAQFAEMVCAQERTTLAPAMAASDAAMALITQLFNRGSLGFDTGD